MAGKTNMQLLTRDEERIDPVLSKYWNPVAGAFIGFTSIVAVRFGLRRPLISGIQSYVIGTGIGGGIGYYIDEIRNASLAERDAVLRHYLETHPEDFPEPERKKFSEVLHPWVPIR
ncbi:hypothetical protein C0J52_03406 [Blattella germanica]|nr:hypothetical protein C0J52_03406 [Blattella germanica]